MAKLPDWAWALIILTGVGGVIYLLYKYFVEPGSIILDTYKKILEDIYREEKTFLEENAKLDPPIYGLTEGQKAIIAKKEEAAERLRPEVERILTERRIDVNAWIVTLISGIIIVYAIKEIVPMLLEKLKQWRTKPESTQIQSSYGHSYLIHEIVTNEMALAGRTAIASGHLSTIQSLYNTYSAPALNSAIAYYQSILPQLTPGTLEYLVVSQLLTYMTFEISASGIMGVLWQFWYPTLI